MTRNIRKVVIYNKEHEITYVIMQHETSNLNDITHIATIRNYLRVHKGTETLLRSFLKIMHKFF